MGEEKFNKLDYKKKQEIINKVMKLKHDALDRAIEKQPYLLPEIIGNVPVEEMNVIKLLNIATKANVSIYDLVDKNTSISNSLIVNIAVSNQPQLIMELDDMPQLQDLITPDTFVNAFTKNPEVLFSTAKALNKNIIVSSTVVNGQRKVKKSPLKVQLQRALNIYFRPEVYTGTNFDEFAKSIADDIKSKNFADIVTSTKMITRSVTAANETLKVNPEKARVMPATALKNWNNRVLYTYPNMVKKQMAKNGVDYHTYYEHMLGLLKNSSLNSFSEEERARFAKKCVAICPDLIFELPKIKAFEHISGKLTVQLSAYEGFKAKNENDKASSLMLWVDDEKRRKDILQKAKANETRRANKLKKASDKNEDNDVVMTLKR